MDPFTIVNPHFSQNLKKSDEMLCEMHRECARDHYQVDKARAIRGEDRMTGRSNFSRVCEKCGLNPRALKRSNVNLFLAFGIRTCSISIDQVLRSILRR